MRSLPALLLFLPCCLLLPGCETLSEDEQQDMALYQRNAGLYWESGNFGQALGLIERGLELDPFDYKLLSLRAAIHLRQSNPPTAPDQRLLDLALEEFEELFALRSVYYHDRRMLFFYGLACEKQGLRLLREAEEQRIGAGVNRQPDPALADRTKAEADDWFRKGAEMLEQLLDRGELMRLCHYHLLQIHAALGDREMVIKHGNEYLIAAASEQKIASDEIARTETYDWEVENRKNLSSLRNEEIKVRTFLANQLYREERYEEALTHLDKVLSLDPTRSADHYNRGRILRQLGRMDAAKADMRTFLATTELPPESPQVVDAVQALAK